MLPIKHRDTGSDHIALRGLVHRRRYALHKDDQTISGKLNRDKDDKGEKGEADGEEEDQDQARRGCVPPYCTRPESWYFSIENFDLSCIFFARAPQTMRRRLAKFRLENSSFNILCILNLSQWYDTSIVDNYLDTTTFKTSTEFYKTTLPSDMIFTKADVSTSDEQVDKLTR